MKRPVGLRINNRFPGIWLFAASLVSIVSVTACLSESNEELVVYSGRSESLVGPIIDQFAQATGIEVSVKYGSTAEIAATMMEEGEKTPADVFFAQDPGGLGAVASMLGGLPADILSSVPQWARSPDGLWVGISGRARTVVYNTTVLSEDGLPDSLMGFTDPRWKGRIGWAPANASFQTMVTAMRVLWGEDETRQWLEGIRANDPQVYPKNTPIVAAAANGEIDVGFVNHYYLHRFIQEDGEDFTARNHFLSKNGPGSLIMVAGAGILESADNRENAERFLSFMLSTVAQQYFAGQTFEYPLVEGVNTHRLLVPLEDVGSPTIDMVALSDVKGTQELLRSIGVIP
jgi:iron(III) transport system substrate-binding protein